MTVTEKQDLQQAMAEVVEAAERSAPPGTARALPLQHLITATPLRLKLIPVASEVRPRVLRPCEGQSEAPFACQLGTSLAPDFRTCTV